MGIDDATRLEDLELPSSFHIYNESVGKRVFVGIEETSRDVPEFMEYEDYHVFSPGLNAVCFVGGDCTVGELREVLSNYDAFSDA